jgi:carbon monoxide dehydrogenase subunit G
MSHGEKMATIRKEITVKATVEQAWDVMRDIGALHTRLVPGFVVDTKLEPGARVVTFANGRVVRERIVTIDDDARRLVWSATGDLLTHHNASAQILEEPDGRSRIIWVADLLPDSMSGAIDQMMDHGMTAMQTTLDGLT